MSFHPVRSGLVLCLVTLMSLGALPAYAQETQEKDDLPQLETVAPEETSEAVSEAVSENDPDMPEISADEILNAEAEAQKEEENASRRAKNDAAALEKFQKGLDLNAKAITARPRNAISTPSSSPPTRL